MLFVGFAGVDRDRAGFELRNEAHQVTLLRLFAGAALFTQPLAQQAANTKTHQRIG
jgi:hypothetical protein